VSDGPGVLDAADCHKRLHQRRQRPFPSELVPSILAVPDVPAATVRVHGVRDGEQLFGAFTLPRCAQRLGKVGQGLGLQAWDGDGASQGLGGHELAEVDALPARGRLLAR